MNSPKLTPPSHPLTTEQVVDLACVSSRVALRRYLEAAPISTEAWINRRDFFISYPLIADAVFDLIKFKHVHLPFKIERAFMVDDSFNPQGADKEEVRASEIESLIDRDGSDVDMKCLLTLVSMRGNASAAGRLSLATVGQHLKGLKPSETGGAVELYSYLTLSSTMGKELLPTTKKEWEAFHSLSQIIHVLGPKVYTTRRGNFFENDKLFAFWKDLSRRGGLSAFAQYTEARGLPEGLTAPEFGSYLYDATLIEKRISDEALSFFERQSPFFKEITVDKGRLIADFNISGILDFAVAMHRIDDLAGDIELRVAYPNNEAITWPSIVEEDVHLFGYQFTPLLGAMGLKREGSELHHCVGGYTSACLKGERFIVSVKALSNDTDRATLELTCTERHNELGELTAVDVERRQCRSFYNKSPSEALSQAADDYISELNGQKGQRLHQYQQVQASVKTNRAILSEVGSFRALLGALILSCEKHCPIEQEKLDTSLLSFIANKAQFYAVLEEKGISVTKLDHDPVHSLLRLGA